MTSTRAEREPETIVPAPASGLTDEWVFLATMALLWLASAGATIHWAGLMYHGMAMPGEGRLGAAVWFMVMWIVMMVAMMLPALVPALSSYRREVSRVGARGLGSLTTRQLKCTPQSSPDGHRLQPGTVLLGAGVLLLARAVGT